MNADSAFVIGTTHSVCQDYVVAGNPANGSAATPYVILSDGCSSSTDTDIGARLLVKSTEKILTSDLAGDVVAVHAEAAGHALAMAAQLDLPPQAVDATLLTAHVHENELILACSGDGVIMVQDWSGVIHAYSISYPSGYPCYPAYAHQPDRLAVQEFSKDRPEGSYLESCPHPPLAAEPVAAPSGILKEIKYFRGNPNQLTLRLEDTFSSGERTEVFTFRARSYQYAVLLSDGIHSFSVTRDSESSKSSHPICFQSVARELVSFKNVRGAFAGRRLKRFLKNCALNGWQHTDDLALGAIHLGD